MTVIIITGLSFIYVWNIGNGNWNGEKKVEVSLSYSNRFYIKIRVTRHQLSIGICDFLKNALEIGIRFWLTGGEWIYIWIFQFKSKKIERTTKRNHSKKKKVDLGWVKETVFYFCSRFEWKLKVNNEIRKWIALFMGPIVKL